MCLSSITQLSLKISKQTLQSDKKLDNFNTASDVINDNSSSQPIAASESGLAAQSGKWSRAEDIVFLVKHKSDLTVG